MDHIKQQASLHGPQRYWSSGKRTGPITVRNVSKNKPDKLQGSKVAPQRFCLDHIPLSAWRYVIWPFLNDPVALWSLGVSNTHMMRLAHGICVMTIRFEPWHSLYDGDCLPGCTPGTSLGPPTDPPGCHHTAPRVHACCPAPSRLHGKHVSFSLITVTS